LVSKPAVLSVNPLAKALLKCCMARQYAKLRGRIEDFGGAATKVNVDSAEGEGQTRQEKTTSNKVVAAPALGKESMDVEGRN
ncbi:MAG TPA: hypothetical protein VKY92_23470, partial [Verrucomicrobiae bacterium]|nr:hypothetical protein [Verrucomicrobiae bacterium]